MPLRLFGGSSSTIVRARRSSNFPTSFLEALFVAKAFATGSCFVIEVLHFQDDGFTTAWFPCRRVEFRGHKCERGDLPGDQLPIAVVFGLDEELPTTRRVWAVRRWKGAMSCANVGEESCEVRNAPRSMTHTGPFCQGTLINMLLEEYPDKLAFSVSHTTRKMR